MIEENLLKKINAEDRASTIANVPDGFLAFVVTGLVSQLSSQSKGLVYVASDWQKIAELQSSISFFAPDLEVIELPAWDCLPYDRVSPSAGVSAQRVLALGKLANAESGDKPLLVLTTVNAWLQRSIPGEKIAGSVFELVAGKSVEMEHVISWLVSNGFEKTPTVREKGEFAVRGGILDLFSPGTEAPVRLDFFGSTIESIRSFDLASQRTTGQQSLLTLAPMNEIVLDDEAIRKFRQNYISEFGAASKKDMLYQATSEGRRFAGLEHWLPLLFDELETLENYCDGFDVLCDQTAIDSALHRLEQIEDHYAARKETLDDRLEDSTPYFPVQPASLYLSEDEIKSSLENIIQVSAFVPPQTEKRVVFDLGCQIGRNFRAERSAGKNVFETLVEHIADELRAEQKILIASWSEGSADRMQKVLAELGLERIKQVENFEAFLKQNQKTISIAALPIEEGIRPAGITVIAEQDVLGDRLVRKSKRKKGSDFISEVASLNAGDIVVHVDHGIARFVGLKTIEALNAPHDCLELHYAGDDRLFLPVENIELLSRYGSEDANVQLDKLGGVAWQARKAKLKKNILEMAEQLIGIAAERALRKADILAPPDGLMDEFNARFPYNETEDQLTAIEAVLDDLSAGMPMDRLVCGDVGFGKTEVAMRAAFVAALGGKQVALVVPTTLLARQHYKSFEERFRGLPVRIEQASRLVGTKQLSETKKGLADGSVEIVIGTHALLAENIKFDRLGLLIIDEEQRFGVKHKERLKELRSDVHVLTLSATPIPRTLQLALTGVRELSLITTAPVDRLAVRTFITPLDQLVIREALLREHYRGGQSFYVCPRISDLEERKQFLLEHVSELKIAMAHGQMTPGELDDVMNAFYDGKYDVLLSTTIVESGLDIPTANTLIVHRADMFGLAQLYQLRGRIGRSKTRAFAIFTLPVNKMLTENAEKRLRVLQSLEGVGAGFELASHDLDIRGSGNLLGEAQSGQIREVGFELYQQMLEEAVAELKESSFEAGEEKWSPQISVGAPVLIPENYVNDLQLRLGLYRRLSDISTAEEIDAFGAELIDRFGPLPIEVDYLLKIVFIKGHCKIANIEKLDAGPKGLVIQFKDKTFKNPEALLRWIEGQRELAKVRPDQSLFVAKDWSDVDKRLKGAALIASNLSAMITETS